MKAAHLILGLSLAAAAAGCRKQGDTIDGRTGTSATAVPTSGTTPDTSGKLQNVGGTTSKNDGGAQTEGTPTQALSLNPDLPVVVRGRWALSFASGDGGGLGLASNVTLFNIGTTDELATQQMNGTVPTQVLFNVTNEGFTDNPTVSNGVVSYGYLTVAALYDNNDHVCGTSGTVKCATAAIRLYTTTTPAAGQVPSATPTTGGAGLWNSTLGVGLPILSGSGKVGFGAANALVVSLDQLTTKNVISLGDFTFTSGTQVPLAVDYTNAPAGSYSATLVIEYVLQ